MSRLDTERPAEQRDACSRAVVDRGIGPGEVAKLAAAGELEPGLAPFTVPAATVSSWASRLRKRRAGEVRTAASATPAAERIAALQARLLNACDHELTAIERAQRKRNAPAIDGERLRQLARALREAAAIAPAPRAAPSPSTSPRPTPPGQRDPETGQLAGARTRGGLAGAILADAGRDTAPSPRPRTSPTDGPHENDTHELKDDREHETTGEAPTPTTDADGEGSASSAVREAGEKVARALAAMEGTPAAHG